MKSLGERIDFEPKFVHIVGVGVMGGEIAIVCCLNGLTVTLQDQSLSAISATLKRAHLFFKTKLKKAHLIRSAMDRLIPDQHGYGCKHADIIIEAVVETLDIKKEVFKEIEVNAQQKAIIATNTSTIPLQSISQVLKTPSRLIGLHFLKPVSKKPVVEVVFNGISEDVVKNKAIAFVKKLGKLPLPVKSAPGFLMNRLFVPYLLESLILLDEGVPAQVVDKAAHDFGMPVGPIELADQVGLDVCLLVAKQLGQELNPIPSMLIELVEAGHLGKKTNHGFYEYKNGKLISNTYDHGYQPPEDLIDRLILSILNQSVACIREGIVEENDLLDAAMIFGTGFAPFLGGPMQYLVAEGKTELKKRLESLAQKHGTRFEVDMGWYGAI